MHDNIQSSIPDHSSEELDRQDLHDMMRRQPTWPVRWGLAMFFLLMLTLVAGSWLIRYPDTIVAPITITPDKPIVMVSVPVDGKLSRLLVGDGDRVTKGQVLAYIQIEEQEADRLQKKSVNPNRISTLLAPISGWVLLPTPSHLLNPIAQQCLLSIEPESKSVGGILKVSESNIGKLLIGQKIIVKLDAYPSTKFGILEGVLSQVSMSTDSDHMYWAYARLSRKLLTRQGFKLTYRQGMQGRAEIITSDRRLIERLFKIK